MTNLIPKRKDFMNFGEDLFGDKFPSFWNEHNFNVDIKENNEDYEVKADLPGFSKENLHVDYQDNILKIQAKKEETEEEKDATYIRKERVTRSFKRQFYLDNVSEDEITATFTDGVLHITLPKEKPDSTGKKIDIQ